MDQNQIYELFKKIDEKVDKISVSQARTEVFLDTIKEDHGEIRSDLKYHIQRTNLLEHEVTKLRGFFLLLFSNSWIFRSRRNYIF